MSRVWPGIRRSLKAAIAIVLGLGLGLFARRPSKSGAGTAKKILVIRIDPRVGNVLLTTPVLDALTASPEPEVCVLVAPSKQDIVEGLCRVLTFDKKSFFTRPWRFAASLWALRRERFDVAIDASHWHEFSVSSAVILALTGAPVRIAHERHLARHFANRLVPAPALGESEVNAKLALLEPLGLSRRNRPMRTMLGTGAPETRKVGEWIEGLGIGSGRIVGLWPGARKANHRAPASAFIHLGTAAVRLGALPVVLWGPGDEEVARTVAAAIERAVMAPATSLGELAALLRRCSAVATNDTGPMHLSVACGTPTVALFYNSDPVRWGHSTAPHVMIPGDGRPQEEVERDGERALVAILSR